MKLTVDDLPIKERKTYLMIQDLPIHEKRVLWKLIRLSNKDHICVIDSLTPTVHVLIEKQLITLNKSFKQPNKISLFVLRKTPFLMKKLQVIGQNS
ncbi:hypothetical protein [Salipaludibacillus daqingensis]|uniref:hypothetical protein n=1 Tax=Salipaludibacillus daqingensis TaxID=3041001 RepID=UPI0024770685|nr:hypothetical protein [Salipaludibacillus daqingensis]